VSAALDQIARLILRESGQRLNPSQYNALRAALGRVAPGSDPVSFLGLASDPAGGRDLVARLIDEITVQETFFLRDRTQLETIDWALLRDRAQASGSQTIRIWSAACATGEEAYSLALLACEAFAPHAPPVRILATDISRAALARAQVASYGNRSTRALDPRLRERYFDQQGGQLVVNERLRKLVTFEQHNLIADPGPPPGQAPLHLILCRNILIYFEASTAQSVVTSLEGALAPGGMLVLGAPDALCVTGMHMPPPAQTGDSASGAGPQAISLRRPLGRVPEQTAGARMARTLHAADRGQLEEAIREASELLVEDPLNAEAYFLHGLVQLEAGNAQAAVKSLRAALYILPTFGRAAFKLGGAHEALGDPAAARRAYEQALRTIELTDDRHEAVLDQVDLGDIAAACETRVLALAEA
jgi:chemotaxis protein methyltransferase CheR